MLQENPSVVYGVLAPLYCMGLIGAPLSRMVRMWLVVAIVVVLIISCPIRSVARYRTGRRRPRARLGIDRHCDFRP